MIIQGRRLVTIIIPISITVCIAIVLIDRIKYRSLIDEPTRETDEDHREHKSEAFRDLIMKYHGSIDASPEAASRYSTKGADRMAELLEEWDPRGSTIADLHLLAGPHTLKDGERLQYIFSGGFGGWMVEFMTESGVVVDFEAKGLQ